MNTEKALDYDAQELHSMVLASNITDKLKQDYSISRAKAGVYRTQRGSFEITSDEFILCVCIWEEGVVELHTQRKDGSDPKIETLRRSTKEAAVERIVDHLDKYA